ncbi:hypothetical protein [Desulfobotulus alkaliphilus]|uniref:hypothetical protein n=1 Tax=Desulfobotulus alkaliphilus TaxID=622671 RepID=UPI00119CA160|nr:hypothetical protein [Desulfobotulus alkaliphilus]
MHDYALISKYWFQQKAIGLFVSDIAIVSDQSFAGLCERSGKLFEPPQRQRAKACHDNQKAYPACGGEFLPLPHRARSSRIRLRHEQMVRLSMHLINCVEQLFLVKPKKIT